MQRNAGRRLLSLLCAVVLLSLLLPTDSFAAVGDVAGDYYSTDIVTLVNRTPIDSINVGGRTLICAEDMAYHGFTVVWDGTARTLKVAKGGSDFSGGKRTTNSNLPVGTRMGSYYYTDIVTYLDGKVIESFNTGGRTFICAEDMASFGYAVAWNASDRTLTVDNEKRPPSVSAPNTTLKYDGKTTDVSMLYSDKSGLGFYTNSADGICVSWCATNQSGKTINYYTCYFTMYNPVGDLAYDQISGKATKSVKVVGPIKNGDSLLLSSDIIGYSAVCSKIVLDKIYLEYADGTTETVVYGYAGYETAWHKY